jgi:murein DD-endopeptidase MepM/ murein hydrolase activator NlpD
VTGLRVTQGFGIKNPRYAAGEHTGIDFGSNGDDTIRCVADGVCVTSSFDHDGFGNYVIVQHPGDRYSWYCHLTRRGLRVGDRVERGQSVGVMGSTGNSTGKHLHYQETVGAASYRFYKRPTLVALDG